jgi:anti-sigma factor RsiW
MSGLSERELAELTAFADGSLSSDRVAAVEARVAASTELQNLVERQRRALAASRALAEESPPASLVQAVEELASKRAGRRSRREFRLVPGLAFAGGLAAAVAVVAAILLTGGPDGPSVAEAARLASQPPNQAAPAAVDRTRLAAEVDGVAFPNFAYRLGWAAVGARRSRIGGRETTVISYRKDGARVGYAIVAGAGLDRPSHAQTTTKGGVEYLLFEANGRPAVTWRRDGHTCVLVGRTSRAVLLRLASWPV